MAKRRFENRKIKYKQLAAELGCTQKRTSWLSGRIVVWFSCGVTSAVAAKIVTSKYKHDHIAILYCDTGSEHPTNIKFLKDVEKWIGHEIKILKSKKYKSHWDVIEKTRYLVGVQGARCTYELKRIIREQHTDPIEDIHVFGFDAGEEKRFDTFKRNNPESVIYAPLLEEQVSKEEALAIVKEAGIDLPMMYLPQKSGAPYNHNNCIGCVKGGMGYWNKIRIDFPDVFNRMAKLERTLGRSCLRSKNKPVFLDELDPNRGVFLKEKDISCGVICRGILSDYD